MVKNPCLLINVLAIFVLIGAPNVSKAQKSVKEYQTNSGDRVIEESYTSFVRILTELTSTDNLWLLEEYYPDQQLRRKGKVRGPGQIYFEGKKEHYYKSGQLREQVLYENGKKAGLASYYYKNGQLQKEVFHTRKVEVPDTLIHYFDSLGTALVVNGDGSVREVSRNGKSFEEGKYIGGLRVGEWRGTFRDGTFSFVEDYAEGKVIAGISTDKNGKEYIYRERDAGPRYGDGYGNGINILRSEVASRYRIPRKAREKSLEGYVVISFKVDKDGKMIDHSIASDLGYGTGEAGIDALTSIRTRWRPGLHRGLPVSVTYSLPFLILAAP